MVHASNMHAYSESSSTDWKILLAVSIKDQYIFITAVHKFVAAKQLLFHPDCGFHLKQPFLRIEISKTRIWFVTWITNFIKINLWFRKYLSTH